MIWACEGDGVTGSKGMVLLWLSDLLLKGLGHQECLEKASHPIDSTYTCH